MAYTPTKWSNNESITATQLNKLENGVSDASEKADLAHQQATESAEASIANGEDIARLFDELDALREALNTLTAAE